MKYSLAIFDMDGTILNTLEDLTDATNYVMRLHGFKEHTIEEVKSFVGNGIMKLIERALPTGSGRETAEQCFNDFIPYYQAHCSEKTRPYDGIPELISALRGMGVATAVVSNKDDRAVRLLCDQYFPGLFDAMAGDMKGINKKPAPDLCERVLRELSVEKSRAVYIGDSDVDIQTARNSGLDEIIVSWGFRSREFQLACGAKRIVDTPEEIEEIFKQ